jgi:exopolysaccharide biosynthesis WecB/TagA/CpsF family protein
MRSTLQQRADVQPRGTTLLLECLCIEGVCFDNTSSDAALSVVRGFLERRSSDRSRTVYFVNVHSLHVARRDHELMAALMEGDLVLPDGSGLAFAGKRSGLPVRQNLNGTDFVPRVLAEAEGTGKTVYLLGAQPQVLQACIARLRDRFPHLKIAGFHHGHFSASEEKHLIATISGIRPDVLLVALGTPLQEQWIARHSDQLAGTLCMGVGGLFDFLSGSTPRAPEWMRRTGIEWVYRFLHNPRGKWERVLVEIPVFFLRVLLGTIAVRKGPSRIHEAVEAHTSLGGG